MAKEFVLLGDSVVINGRNAQTVEEARSTLEPFCKARGQKVVSCVCDVATADGSDSLARTATTKLGGLDVWINNAGTTQNPKATLAATEPAEIERVVSTNLFGVLFGCRAALNAMSEGGTIFNMDGTGSRGNATPRSAAYGVSKAALPQLAKTLAQETRGTGVKVHTLSPGMVMTPLLLEGASPSSLKIFNILAEHPETTAAWLVPRIRGATDLPSGQYIKYLTPSSVVWRFATAWKRRDRLVKVDA